MSVNSRGFQSQMHDGGGGLFTQGLKEHTIIGLVVTAECYGHKESKVLCLVSWGRAAYPTVSFVHLSSVLHIAKYRTLPVSLEYTLCALSKFADQGPFDRFKSLGNNLP